MGNSLEIFEKFVDIIREELPFASDEQIADVFAANASEIAAIVIGKIGKELPSIIDELDLPPDSQIRVDNRRKRERAKRSKESARGGIIKEAISTRRYIEDLRTWQSYYADRGEVKRANDYAGDIAKFQNASTTKEEILSRFDNDLTGNIINYEENSEEDDKRSIQKLEELINGSRR